MLDLKKICCRQYASDRQIYKISTKEYDFGHQHSVLSHLSKILKGNALFSGKIYTAAKKFTRPPVATVVTNFKSEEMVLQIYTNAKTFYPVITLGKRDLAGCRHLL